MLTGDSRDGWDGAWLTDPRAVHLWDEQKVVGNWYADHVTRGHGTAWDAYFLYGPPARWESRPPALITWGGTIEREVGELQAGLAPLLRS